MPRCVITLITVCPHYSGAGASMGKASLHMLCVRDSVVFGHGGITGVGLSGGTDHVYMYVCVFMCVCVCVCVCVNECCVCECECVYGSLCAWITPALCINLAAGTPVHILFHSAAPISKLHSVSRQPQVSRLPCR